MKLQHNREFAFREAFWDSTVRPQQQQCVAQREARGSGAVRGMRALFGWTAGVSVAALVGIVPRSLAQEIAPTGQYEENGLEVSGWKLYPKAFVGAVWDPNVDQQASGALRTSSV